MKGSADEGPLLDLLWLRPGLVGGSETYVISLLEAMAEAGHTLDLAVPPGLTSARPEVTSRHRCHEVSVRGGRPGRILLARRHFAGDPSRVVHHLGGTVPSRGSALRLATIYDAQVYDLPQNFGLVKRQYLRRALPAAVSRAQVVCVMSEFVASSLELHLGLERARVRVVPPGFHAAPADGDRTGVPDAPYLLYPAVTWPHKRHRFLLDVLDAVDDADLRLVFTGGRGSAHEAVLDAIQTSPHRDRVMHLGRVPGHRLQRLYHHAEALVFPSAYEGFGQPVVEAMAAGCPVVTSRAGALVEVAGAAGQNPPLDAHAWAVAIAAARGSERARWVTAGVERAAQYSMESSAEAQLAVYDELLG